MKRLGWLFVVIMIIFLFSPLWWGSFVFGQSIDEEVHAFTTNQSYNEYLAELDKEYDILHPRERVITVGDVLDYAEEVYNDSTEDSYLRVLDGVVIIYFRHPEPTFKGFKEWLEK